ncbi:class I SAM-dependent methyltransferase [Actinomycetospora callitridis]|uniref:class I SAM-dependent methyltransferase n=1 Tax=Actinomycetospora callitridis TaxID=913944 RepID=UPI002365631B|nr:class I SAM-dependent methyltransferase [Actinomycetospora callitridis]MDD7917727.1 class I SAM-dependent methyltransferase [Actinomycetospora callitridis]
MSPESVDLRGSETTMLITLYLRERDARSAHPVLGDRFAGEVLARVQHDPGALRWFSSDTATICARARRLDEWTVAFLGEHPDGQVLHLGCGLDSRPLRVARPPGSRWIDVDVPRVADLRRRVYDLPDDIETVSASVTDPGWWERLDADRPTLALAEGLFMYLAPPDVHAVLDRLLTRCASGQVAFDAVAGWTLPVSNAAFRLMGVDTRFAWGFDGAELTARHPRLRERDDVTVSELASTDTVGLRHRLYRGFDAVPVLREAMRLHRYTF